MSNSFYGGRDGRAMVIKKQYETIVDMTNDFKNPEYTEVGFGEHVIIKSVNRNNPENGRVFRRGLDFQNEERNIDSWELNFEKNEYVLTEIPAYGAILCGQIVGPAGDAPHFQPVPFVDEEGVTQTLDSIKQKYEAYDVMSGEGVFDVTTGNLVPGKSEEGIFTDDITWKHTSIRDRNAESSTAYIDFTFPYDIIEFDADTKDSYFHRSDVQYDADGNEIEGTKINIFENLDLVERHAEDDQTHPFYQKWQIHIPKGIHGKSVEAVYVTTAHNDVVEFELNDKNELQYGADGKLIVKDYEVEGEENAKADDIANSRKILVCDIVDYDRVPEGDRYIIYLGDYNMIDDISLTDEGTFTIQYAHDNDYVRPNLIKWITGVSLNVDNGAFQIDFNNLDPSYTTSLQWVKDVIFDEYGTINIDYTNKDNTVYDKLVNWIKSISITQEGHLTVVSNNGNIDYETDLVWIDSAELDNNGNFIIYYNNKEVAFEKQLLWVREASFDDETGIITLTRTDGSTTTCAVDMIKSISLNQETGELSIQSTDNASNKNLTATLDWIKSANLSEAKVLTINYVNAEDVELNLKTPNRIYLESSKFKADYNDNTTEELGDFTDLQISCVAADSEENVDINLKIGGLWFITQDQEV